MQVYSRKGFACFGNVTSIVPESKLRPTILHSILKLCQFVLHTAIRIFFVLDCPSLQVRVLPFGRSTSTKNLGGLECSDKRGCLRQSSLQRWISLFADPLIGALSEALISEYFSFVNRNYQRVKKLHSTFMSKIPKRTRNRRKQGPSIFTRRRGNTKQGPSIFTRRMWKNMLVG